MFKCGHCGKIFRTKKSLFSHMDKFMGECGDLIDISGESEAIDRQDKGISEAETSYTE